MALYFVLGTFAAFGVLCAVWVVFGWMLPGSCGVLRYCPGKAEDAMNFAERYLWMKRVGLIHCALVIADAELDETEKRWLTERGICVECQPEPGIGAESN